MADVKNLMNERMEGRRTWLNALLESGEAPIPEKVDGLLTALGEVRREREIIATAYNEFEEDIKRDLWRILEEHIDGEKHESEVGRAQIVRPGPRISYDNKGLETLRLSSDDMQRLIGHLRRETTGKPSLRVKLK